MLQLIHHVFELALEMYRLLEIIDHHPVDQGGDPGVTLYGVGTERDERKRTFVESSKFDVL